MPKILPSEVVIRKFLEIDIEPLASYWTEGPDEFFTSRGVNRAKMKSKLECISSYKKAFAEECGIRDICTIVFRDRAVGVHTLTHLIEETEAIFHAHIWKEEDRKIGIGEISYIKGMDFFFETLKLKKIVFKTPKINIGANRLKQKLGIPCLGETIFDVPILIRPLSSYLYEVDKLLLDQLKKKRGI